MQRIGIIGAPSTGKTTLARNLVTELNMSGHIAEYVPEYAARYIKKYGVPEEPWENIRIFNKQLEWENNTSEMADFMVTDSPLILPFLYSMYGFQPEDPKSRLIYTDLFKMTLKELSRYSLFVYLKPSFAPVDDGIRVQTDTTSQMEVDNKIKTVFELFRIIPLTLEQSDLESRVAECMVWANNEKEYEKEEKLEWLDSL